MRVVRLQHPLPSVFVAALHKGALPQLARALQGLINQVEDIVKAHGFEDAGNIPAGRNQRRNGAVALLRLQRQASQKPKRRAVDAVGFRQIDER